jgi:membrane protein
MALAVGGGVAGAGAAAAGSITGQTAAPSKPQPAETNQPSATVVESPTEAGSEDASDDGETSNGGIFARIAEFFRTLLEPRKDSGEMVEKTFGEIRDAINFGFNTVENTLRDSGNFPFIDGSAVVGAIANVMLPIGLLVFLICWSLQVMRSGLELELYEVKHFIKMGMEFIAGLLLVTIAPQICKLITAISDNMASSLLDTVSIHYADIAETLPSTDIGDFASKIPIIGVLVQWINFLWSLPSIFMYNMIVMITAGIMLFSLGIRIIKLTIYQGFAPLFIAAGANQDTKRFCINFLASYILLSLQLVVMTVVYAMFRTSFAAYLASAASITTFSWKGFFTGGIFMIIYAVIMVKSDRLFDKVLH